MAKKVDVGINDVARNVRSIYVGINDVARKVTKGYVGVNGVARLFYLIGDYLTTEQGDTLTTENGEQIDVESVPYTPVDYIVSTGYQYIDTGFKHNNNTRIVAKIEYCSVNSGGWYYPFGSFGGTSGTNRLFCGEISTSNTLQTYYGTGHNFNIDCNGVHTYDLNKNVHKIDNTTYTYESTTFQSDYNFIIFGHTAYSGATGITPIATKLYYFKIYDNGTLVRDYIPVLDENGVACLYDQVNEVFCYNQGTGEFYTNNDEYITVQNIQSSGTEYMDTGIVPTNTFKIDTELARTDLTITDGVCGSNANSIWGMYLYLASNGKIACAYGTQNVYVVDNTNFYDTNRHHIVLDLSSADGLKTTVDDVLQSTKSYSAISNNVNFYLFKCNDGGTNRKAKVRMFSFKIYNNGTLVRDFVPVLKNLTSEFGLYDNVSETFFANGGTNNFVFRKI